MQDKGMQENERIAWMIENLGYGRAKLQEYKEKFGRGEARYYEDRKEALALMKEKLQADADQWKSDLVARLEKLYERNVENGRNQGVALEVLKTLAKLTGNLEEKVKVDNGGSFSIKWDKEEKDD